ncbi:hypothetical protein GCM10022377_08170 [Zhihengliuella alba]|uniref:Uncharacterized protein n=2 Tax=Zhihengliuella alba TaxID=547018 RepID=A0ABP7D332_9MICC
MVLVVAIMLLLMLVSTVVRRSEGAAERQPVGGRTAIRQMNAAPTSDALVPPIRRDRQDYEPAPGTGRSPMNATGQRDASELRPAPESAPAGPAPLRIRWGRVAVALAGVAGLALFAVTGVVALFGAVSGLVPLLGLAAFVLAVAGLRTLAVRDRRRRVLARINRTYADAVEAAQEQVAREQERTETPSRARGGELFDGQPGQAERRAPTVQELREEARRVAAREREQAGPSVADTRTWTPVDVPTPTYVKAAKAERPEPAPMPRPEERRAQFVTSILADTRAQSSAAQSSAASSSAATSSTAQPSAAHADSGRAASAPSGAPRINLDDVLQRRRGA